MNYNKTIWLDRQGTDLNKFTKINDTTSTVQLVNTPTAITQQGTEFTSERLNNIEYGIDNGNSWANAQELFYQENASNFAEDENFIYLSSSGGIRHIDKINKKTLERITYTQIDLDFNTQFVCVNNNVLYFSVTTGGTGNGKIQTVTNGGAGVIADFKVGLTNVRGIATDGTYIYVAEAIAGSAGTVKKIEIANGNTTIILSGLNNPYGMVYFANRLYLAESGTGKIIQINPADNSTVDMITGLTTPDYIRCFGSFAQTGSQYESAIYYTEQAGKSIKKYDMYTSTTYDVETMNPRGDFIININAIYYNELYSIKQKLKRNVKSFEPQLVKLSTKNIRIETISSDKIILTGALTADITMTLPITYYVGTVINNCTGDYSVNIVPPTGIGVTIRNGDQAEIVCENTAQYSFKKTVNVGTIQGFGNVRQPAGRWLPCDGSAISRTAYLDLYSAITKSMGTVTITIASPSVVTLSSHGLSTGQQIELTTTGALPTGLTINTNYFVIKIDANTFWLATSIENALAGTKINTSGTQSGVHSLRFCPFGISGASNFLVPDLRGIFIKGSGTTNRTFGVDAAGNSYSAAHGVQSQDKIHGHNHSILPLSSIYGFRPVGGTLGGIGAGSTVGEITSLGNMSAIAGFGTPRVSTLTEPQHVGVNYFISY